MRKGLLAICSVLAVAIVLLAVLVPSCTPAPTTGTIEVKATLDGSPWTGAVNYTLIPASGSNITGNNVTASFSVAPGSWNCTYVSGGPPAAYFVNITPSATQSVSAGGNITFTLNFVTFAAAPLDASITFISWSINGTRVPPGTYTVGPNTTIDAEYAVHVSGAQGATVTVQETSWLLYHYTGGEQGMSRTLHAVNAWGAVSMNPPATKLTQMTSVGGVDAPFCTLIQAWHCEPVMLDVKTTWKLVICNNYTKTINWLGIPSPTNILFDDVTVPNVAANFTLNTTWSCVDVEGDVNPQNNCSTNTTALVIQYMPGP
jgi:hypothetical protein